MRQAAGQTVRVRVTATRVADNLVARDAGGARRERVLLRTAVEQRDQRAACAVRGESAGPHGVMVGREFRDRKRVAGDAKAAGRIRGAGSRGGGAARGAPGIQVARADDELILEVRRARGTVAEQVSSWDRAA